MSFSRPPTHTATSASTSSSISLQSTRSRSSSTASTTSTSSTSSHRFLSATECVTRCSTLLNQINSDMAEICARENVEWRGALFGLLCVAPLGVFAREAALKTEDAKRTAREVLGMAKKITHDVGTLRTRPPTLPLRDAVRSVNSSMRILVRALFKATGAHGDAQTRPIKFAHVTLLQRVRSRGASFSSQLSWGQSGEAEERESEEKKSEESKSGENRSEEPKSEENQEGQRTEESALESPSQLQQSEYSLMNVGIAM